MFFSSEVSLGFSGPLACMVEGPLFSGGCSLHGSAFGDFLEELRQTSLPVLLHWGDEDGQAKPELVASVQEIAASKSGSLTVKIFPGIGHGYTARSSPAYNADISSQSVDSIVSMINELVKKE